MKSTAIKLLCLLFIVGCNKGITYERKQLRCGMCDRVIYDGDFEIHPNGFEWPVGEYHHCPPWDINCVSTRIPEFTKEYKTQMGYKDGRKDALEFKYHMKFDPKIHHPYYIEAYNKGYKEVIDVRNGR